MPLITITYVALLQLSVFANEQRFVVSLSILIYVIWLINKYHMRAMGKSEIRNRKKSLKEHTVLEERKRDVYMRFKWKEWGRKMISKRLVHGEFLISTIVLNLNQKL